MEPLEVVRAKFDSGRDTKSAIKHAPDTSGDFVSLRHHGVRVICVLYLPYSGNFESLNLRLTFFRARFILPLRLFKAEYYIFQRRKEAVPFLPGPRPFPQCCLALS